MDTERENRNDEHYRTFNCDDAHFCLKARIEGRSGVFVQPERPTKNVQKIIE